MRMFNRPAVAVGRIFIEISRDESATVLRILNAGWDRALHRSQMHAGSGEVEITECLRDGMEEALNDGVVMQNKQISVLPGTQSRSSPDILKPDGLTDISIHFQRIREEYDQHPPHAIIECKRVAGDRADLCRLYVVEGIDDRFKAGKYAASHAVAFMTGYLLAGDARAATDGINKYLTGKGRQSEHLRSSTFLEVSWAWISNHQRRNLSAPIDLHHAFFAF